jgi:hypothetical protein
MQPGDNSPPRVLIAYAASLPGGAVGARLLYAVARLLRERVAVDVVAPRRRRQRYTERNGLGRIYRVPVGEDEAGSDAEGRYTRAVQRQLGSEEYSAAIVADPLSAAAIRAAAPDLRLIYVLREIRPAVCIDFGRRWEEAMSTADLLVVPSNAVADTVVAHGVPRARVQVLSSQPELRGLRTLVTADAEGRIGIPAFDAPAEAFVVAAELAAEHQTLLFCDRGPTLDELDRAVLARGLSDSIRVVPVGTPRGYAKQLSAVRLVVVPAPPETYRTLALPSGDLAAVQRVGTPVVVLEDGDPSTGRMLLDRVRFGGAVQVVEPSVEPLQATVDRWLGLVRADGRDRLGIIESGAESATGVDFPSGSATQTDWADTDFGLGRESTELSEARRPTSPGES